MVGKRKNLLNYLKTKDIERYRSLVDVLINFEEEEFLDTRMKEFNDYLDLFL